VYWVLPERLRVLSAQAERSLRPSRPLLIRGFGVRVPGGAPVLTWGFSGVKRYPVGSAWNDLIRCLDANDAHTAQLGHTHSNVRGLIAEHTGARGRSCSWPYGLGISTASITSLEIAALAPTAELLEPWKDPEHLPATTEAVSGSSKTTPRAESPVVYRLGQSGAGSGFADSAVSVELFRRERPWAGCAAVWVRAQERF
jgi:hypothetical protein